jgi:hypothetical protein
MESNGLKEILRNILFISIFSNLVGMNGMVKRECLFHFFLSILAKS